MMRIGFVGAGAIAALHAQAMCRLGRSTIVGVTSARFERAVAFALQYGGTPYSSLVDLLDRGRPDVVWVCVPPSAHGPLELALLERCIPFWLEKPIAINLHTAPAVLDAIERTGTMVGVAYMSRYRRGVGAAQRILAADRPLLLQGLWAFGYDGTPAWWGRKAESGGQIVEQTTHLFDLARYLVGEPLQVSARPARGVVSVPGCDFEPASVVTIEFNNGAVGTLASCCGARAGGSVGLQVLAREHDVSFRGWDCHAEIRGVGTVEVYPAEPNIFEIEVDSFISAVERNDVSLVACTYADAMRTLAFCLAANRALEDGSCVPVAAIL
ncbi:MAG: Gfo/Idh/MocA family protein [Anaerolineae bacterium]